MFGRLLSRDYPGNGLLTALAGALVVAMVAAPFLGWGPSVLNLLVKVAIYSILVASFDLMLGYTGIISFAHTMFFGLGAYGVAIGSRLLGPGWTSMALGLVSALVLSVALAVLIGLFSMRVRTIFFAMITLAVATVFSVLVTQFHGITGGQDGILFRVPRELTAAFRPFTLFGTQVNGVVLSYFLILFASAILFCAMLRIVNSPFGRVLQAIRENEFRAEALGFSVLSHRLAIGALAAIFACLAGGLNAIWLRFISPDVTLSLQIMLDILLIVVIGGMGTLYGALIGAGLFVIAENYLMQVIQYTADAFGNVPLVSILVQPQRWMFWLGILFVLSVYYFPEGVVGRLRDWTKSRAKLGLDGETQEASTTITSADV
jgi:branched-chain amino acid transport system permease protein